MTKNSADERRSTRARVMLTAAIESERDRIPVTVDDLSAHGVRVVGEGLPAMDTSVTFQCKNLSVKGFVAWVQPPLVGIGFGEPIDPQHLLRKISRPAGVDQRDFRRPGFRDRPLTQVEKQIIEEWARPQQLRLGE
ncbi:MAG: PilZ domain-containing protein [Sphingomicrobium sp.]